MKETQPLTDLGSVVGHRRVDENNEDYSSKEIRSINAFNLAQPRKRTPKVSSHRRHPPSNEMNEPLKVVFPARSNMLRDICFWSIDFHIYSAFGSFSGGKGVGGFGSHLQKKEEVLQLPGGGLSFNGLGLAVVLLTLLIVLFRLYSGHQSGQQWHLATGKQRAQREQSSFNGFPAVGQV